MLIPIAHERNKQSSIAGKISKAIGR